MAFIETCLPKGAKMNAALKTVTFAAVHFTVAFTVAYALTGNIGISGALALLEPACNTVAYFFHEKAWSRWGGQGGAEAAPHTCSPLEGWVVT